MNLFGKMNDIVKVPAGHLSGSINQSQLCQCEDQDINQSEKYSFRYLQCQHTVVVREGEEVSLLRKNKHNRPRQEDTKDSQNPWRMPTFLG